MFKTGDRVRLTVHSKITGNLVSCRCHTVVKVTAAGYVYIDGLGDLYKFTQEGKRHRAKGETITGHRYAIAPLEPFDVGRIPGPTDFRDGNEYALVLRSEGRG